MPNQHLVESKGIYHGLPVYPSSTKGLTAIITGANGISGYYMMRVLAQAPERWSTIYCLSRRPPYIPGGLPSNVTHIPCDFLKEPEDIAAVLRENKVQRADHVFFFAYVQPPPKAAGAGIWSDVDELVRVNRLLLVNFLGALDKVGIVPKRFMLQTGAKNYGIHLGPAKLPNEESDPRPTLEPNFYYPQEDELWAWCKARGVGWNVAMPSFIFGAVPDAAMNLAFPLAVYATVCRHLGEPMVFSGDIGSWQSPQVGSSAMLNAYQEEWMVLTEATANQKFNTADNSALTWEGTWPRIAGWYGVKWEGPSETAEYKEANGPYAPPPRGYGPAGKLRWRYMMPEWAKQTKVLNAWKEIAKENDLSVTELKNIDRIFAFLDGMLLRPGAMLYSMDKTAKYGWHGMVDSNESLLEVFDDLAKLKMIPPVPKVKVSFN